MPLIKRPVGRPSLDPKLRQKNRIQVKLDSETYRSLIQYCLDRNVTVSQLLKDLIKQTLER